MKLLFSFSSLIDRLFIVAGAFAGSQISPFMQQYSHRLAGHAIELQRIVEQLQKTASLSHKSLDQYIQKFLSSSDSDFVHQGVFMQGIVERSNELNHALSNLMISSPWMRPFVLTKDLQPDIAKATLATFQPALTLNLEGIFYAGLGILFGWLLYKVLAKCISFVYTGSIQMIKTAGRLVLRPLNRLPFGPRESSRG